jgi:hypothetical protein
VEAHSERPVNQHPNHDPVEFAEHWHHGLSFSVPSFLITPLRTVLFHESGNPHCI